MDQENNYSVSLTLDSVDDNSPEHLLEADPELEPTPTLPEFTPMAVPTFNWGPLAQLCAGQIAGIEAGIHSVRDLFKKRKPRVSFW